MNMNTKRNLRKDERAVSPVIGVILMVAITVIMAAVIGAFVYGYSGSMTQMKDVSATARHQGILIYITYTGGPDQALVDGLITSCPGTILGTPATLSAVGDVVTYTGVAEGQGNHVVVTASFTDGTDQVILDSFC